MDKQDEGNASVYFPAGSIAVMHFKAAGRLLLSAIFVCVSLNSYAGSGHEYPVKPVRFVVPFPPGGSTDVIARAIARNLSNTWGQTVVVDNRPGAGTNIGTAIVAKSAPDGYAMLIATPGHAVNVSLYENLPFDPIRSFEMVTLVAITPTLLVVHATLPAENVKSLIELARAKPGGINFGSFGSGTSAHLAGELFNLMAGVRLVHVPYKGGAPALVAVVSNEVQVLFAATILTLPQVRNGKLRALAVTSQKRLSILPDIPAVAETLPGFEGGAWHGIMVAAGTPRVIVEKINRSVLDVLNKPESKEMFAAQGAEIRGSTPEELKSYVKQEIERWAKVVKAANIRVE